MTSLSETGDVVILDGGFSSQLSCHINTTIDGNPLWTAGFVYTNPEDVVKTHLDFLRAGADIIMTNTYQAWVGGFVKYLNVSHDEAYSLFGRAVSLAKQARNIYLEESREHFPVNPTPMIVGSIGPYGAHLNDCSEYHGNYSDVTSSSAIRDWHKTRVDALVEAGVDLLAFETIPCLKEAEVLVEMLKDYPNTKAWISFSCKNNKNLAHGEDFQVVARKCWDANPEQLVAVGLNCCSPKIVAELFEGINDNRQDKPIPLIVYPNSGENYNKEIGWIDRDKCEALDHFVSQWLDLGVKYVGGCCRTYGTDITAIRTQVQSWCDKKRFKSLAKHSCSN